MIAVIIILILGIIFGITVYLTNKKIGELKKEIEEYLNTLDILILNRIDLSQKLANKMELDNDDIEILNESKDKYINCEKDNLTRKEEIASNTQKLISDELTKEILDIINCKPDMCNIKDDMVINENKLKNNKEKYNELVLEYNKLIESMPGKLLVKLYNYEKQSFFEIKHIKMYKNV